MVDLGMSGDGGARECRVEGEGEGEGKGDVSLYKCINLSQHRRSVVSTRQQAIPHGHPATHAP